MPDFTPDPRSCFVAHLDDVPYEVFGNLPPHPAQRQTMLHAAQLMISGVLTPSLDQHREVSALLIGDAENGITIEKMVAAFKKSWRDALAKYGVKDNGHTRHFLWENRDDLARPSTVRLSVYAAADRESAVQQYNAIDSFTAAKVTKHVMQSTLNIASITPHSSYITAATQLDLALNAAFWVLHGGTQEVRKHIRKLLPTAGIGVINDSLLRPELYRLLPYLGAVELFKPAILALDEIDLKSLHLGGQAPIQPVAFVAGYLSILHRNPVRGREFMDRLQQEESSEYALGYMNGFYAVKKVHDFLLDPQRRARSTDAQRSEQVLAAVLNSYEDWLKDPTHLYPADDFRRVLNTRILRTFNPILKNGGVGVETRIGNPGPRLVRPRDRVGVSERIRELAIADREATVDDIIEILVNEGYEYNRGTVQSLRYEVNTTLRLAEKNEKKEKKKK